MVVGDWLEHFGLLQPRPQMASSRLPCLGPGFQAALKRDHLRSVKTGIISDDRFYWVHV